jgi:ubiquinone biosynthesis protein
MNSILNRIPWFTHGSTRARSRQITSVLVRNGLGWLIKRLGNRSAGDSLFGEGTQAKATAVRLREALTELGATFIKVGQALSARYDLLPAVYTQELGKLQDEIPAMPYPQIEALFEQELGIKPAEVFAEFDPEPLASASIGQVYAARLKSGEEVAVKIIRPGVERQVETDLDILADMANWATRHTELGHRYDLVALVDEFAYTVRNELNYLREGRNADIFRRNFKDDPRIHIPYVYWELSTRRVLTLERVKGVKITDLEGLIAAGISRRTVTENLMHFALEQIFMFGLYHADPHPGNFFVQPDGSLAVMDFGMVGTLNQQMKHTLLGMAQAIQRKDSNLMVDELLAAGIYRHSVKRRDLARDLDHLLEGMISSSIQDLSATSVMRDLMSVALDHGLQLPSELVAMSRAIMISEGTANKIYPDFHLVEFAAPYFKRFWQHEQSPEVVLPRLGQAAADSLEMGISLPRRVDRLLDQMESGQMQINMNTDWLRDILVKLQHMTNRLAVSVILAGVIVALGLTFMVFHPTSWQSYGNVIFAFAFISSLFFGGWLMWSILTSRR